MPKKKKQQKKDYFVHKTAIIEENVQLGPGTKIWHYSHIRENTKIGQNCIIGSNVFIDIESQIGDNVKIQNRAIIYHQALIENGVFIGPNVCFTNDKIPRAVNPDGSLKSADDWEVSTIKVGEGAAIGAHSVITPGVTIGKWALIGSGSVVTQDLPDFALSYGNPARIYDFVCKCGKRLKEKIKSDDESIAFQCACGLETVIPQNIYKLKEKSREGEKKKVWLR
ncbi:MAG: N-acetyltransferase [Patescibacteria group bacterium]|nr:N-acetyltransferase [Patescibacteria group bacterium]